MSDRRLPQLAAASAVLWGALVSAQTPAPSPTVVGGVPVNYDEGKVGSYTLPDLLRMTDGTPVKDATTWYERRRPEIRRLFEDHQFGRSPAARPRRFDVFDKGTSALAGKALRRQVTVFFGDSSVGPKMELLVYLPSRATGPVPLLLNLSFSANQNLFDDPGIKPGEIWARDTNKKVPASTAKPARLDIAPFLDKGIGFATVYYGDIDPDFEGGLPHGVRSLFSKAGADADRSPDEWGAIGAWAHGLSRAIDYFETDTAVDARRIAVLGHSRLGKTVLWAGASDPRIAMVIATCSGEGGASLSRRDYGETVKHLGNRFPYWFARNYLKYGDAVAKLPVDSHMLLSLIAPRPLLLTTGDTDLWADPKGEFLAAVAASPVYTLLGKQGLETKEWPPAGEEVLRTIGYRMHSGGHAQLPEDWALFLRFMEMHLLGASGTGR